MGDRVTFVKPKPPRLPGHDDVLVPLGEEAVVARFGIRAVPRQFPQGPLAPGFYLDRRHVFVRWRGTVRTVIAPGLRLPEVTWQTRYVAHAKAFPDTHAIPCERVADLPDGPFWEGDLVAPERGFLEGLRPDTFRGHACAYGIEAIQYSDPPHILPMNHAPYVSLAERLGRKTERRFSAGCLRLVRRGNLWRQAHGEPLAFDDLAEEALFFLGQAVRVAVQPAPLAIEVQRLAALDAVRRGEAHGVRYSWDFSGWGADEEWTAYRYPNADLGARIARATIEEGFQIPGDERMG